jgi:hypothetical protein
MTTTELDPAIVGTVGAERRTDTQVFMLNLLRFRERADYGVGSEFTPCSGKEAYLQRYLPAFAKVAAGDGTSLFFAGEVFASLVGPTDEHWDDIAIVVYPTFDVFRKITDDPQYAKEADPHRRAALLDWRLIATTKLTMPA